MELPLEEVMRLVAAVNAARGHRDAAHPASAARPADDTRESREALEALEALDALEAWFHVGRVLAVYGTLAPGKPNHHVVAPLGGAWTQGVVEGELSPVGWGVTLGYPAFRPRSGGAPVAVHVLTSARLPAAWARLDAFEGAEYRRILVPVFAPGAAGARRLVTVANLYAVADGRVGARAR
ncbi:MAG TPA: gamma-glutamylcyclotransferase [Gemmatirosa sp.]|nr:gamma-glutamylcyclotransferase [Gemmatirosa sp.]